MEQIQSLLSKIRCEIMYWLSSDKIDGGIADLELEMEFRLLFFVAEWDLIWNILKRSEKSTKFNGLQMQCKTLCSVVQSVARAVQSSFELSHKNTIFFLLFHFDVLQL